MVSRSAIAPSRFCSAVVCGGEVDVQARCTQINLADALIVFRPFQVLPSKNEVASRVAETVEDVVHVLTAHIINRAALRIGQ
jgi:hypothetical protein